MNWIYYLLEANFYLVIFYLFYYFIFRRETYYQLNRAYLLVICVLSFIIPLLQAGILKKQLDTAPKMIEPTVTYAIHPMVIRFTTAIPAKSWAAADYYLAGYGLVVLALLVILSVKLIKLWQLARQGKRTAIHAFYLIEIESGSSAFSFLRYLFINPETANSSTIIAHELVHIRQKHSLDILFLEIFKTINWFNPVVYLLQGSLKEVHEFIADRETVNQQLDVNLYTDFLLKNAYSYSESTLTNNFFNKNLLKKRIMMLYQKPSGSLARLKYLVTIPLCVALVCISTLGFAKNYGWIDLIPRHTLPTPHLYANTNQLFKVAADQLTQERVKKAMVVKFPPPVITEKAYNGLYQHVKSTAAYPLKAKEEHQTGIVVLNFDLNDGIISNVSVANSAGHGFDEVAVKSVQSYKRSINDKDGTHQIGVGFYSFYSGDQITVSQQTMENPAFAGEVIIFENIPAQLAKPKGSALTKKTAPPVVLKTDTVPAKPAPPANSPDAIKQTPPPPPAPHSVSADVMPKMSAPPAARRNGSADIMHKMPPPPPRYASNDDFKKFYKQLGKTTRYPTDAFNNNYSGRIILEFLVDQQNKIQNVTVVRGLSKSMNDETARALRACDASDLKPGLKYTITVAFVVLDKNGNPISDNGKTPIYHRLPDDKTAGNEAMVRMGEVVIDAFK